MMLPVQRMPPTETAAVRGASLRAQPPTAPHLTSRQVPQPGGFIRFRAKNSIPLALEFESQGCIKTAKGPTLPPDPSRSPRDAIQFGERLNYSRKDIGLIGAEFLRTSKCSFGRDALPDIPESATT